MRVLTLVALTLLVCCWIPHANGQKMVEPPFVRKWTAMTGDNVHVIEVREGVVYYGCRTGVGAVDLTTGQQKWRYRQNAWIPSAALQGRTLYAIANSNKVTTLEGIDIATGQARTVLRPPAGCNALGVDAEKVYLLDKHGKLSAYPPNFEKALWSRQLNPALPSATDSARMSVTPEGVYVAIDNVGDFGVGKQDGKILWRHPSRSAAFYPAFVVGGDVITQFDGLTRLDMRTGQTVWKGEAGGRSHVRVADLLIGEGPKGLLARDVATGHLRWQFPLDNALRKVMPFYQYSEGAEGENAWIGDALMLSISREGKENWHRERPFTGRPAYTDRERVVTTDRYRIFGYTTGTLPPLPTFEPEKQALAERLVAQYEILDDAERAQLEKLTPYAFPLLLARYVAWAKAYEATPRDKQNDSISFMLQNMGPLLQATARKEDTDAMVRAWTSLEGKKGWRTNLVPLLVAKGESARYIPAFVQSLLHPSRKDEGQWVTLKAVCRSSDPAAVAFLLKALRDPNAPVELRREAFFHLADTGGAEGIQAVLAARAKPGPRKPWFDTIDLAHLPRADRIGVETDERGRTWMLFRSAALGNYGDIFLVQKMESTWGRPLFTGLWTDSSDPHTAPGTFRGIPLAKVLSGDWINLLPDDPEIRQDTDGDGLTDLVEARLGADPYRADTDGDGLSDLVDPCPNAPARPLGDTEKIIAACVEARFFATGETGAAAISADNVKPFKLYGYPSTLLWRTAGQNPSALLYARDEVVRITFPRARQTSSVPTGALVLSSTSASVPQNKAHEPNFIRYDADHRVAHAAILGGPWSFLTGYGNEVTLRKIGDEWFVVDFEMIPGGCGNAGLPATTSNSATPAPASGDDQGPTP